MAAGRLRDLPFPAFPDLVCLVLCFCWGGRELWGRIRIWRAGEPPGSRCLFLVEEFAEPEASLSLGARVRFAEDVPIASDWNGQC